MRCDTLMNRWPLCSTPSGQQPLTVKGGDRVRREERKRGGGGVVGHCDVWYELPQLLTVQG